MCDSTFSHYNPSVYDVILSPDADEDEVAMHEFLNDLGVHQVNVKQQLEAEKRTVCSASPNLSQRFSLLRMKSPPSFMQKRRERMLSGRANEENSTKDSSSNGPKSQNTLS